MAIADDFAEGEHLPAGSNADRPFETAVDEVVQALVDRIATGCRPRQ
jgi:hypothetical protein